MNDDQLIRDLRALDQPVDVDRQFADRLFPQLLEERRPRRMRRPYLLMAATLLIGGAIVGALAVGGGVRPSEPRTDRAQILPPIAPSATPGPTSAATIQEPASPTATLRRLTNPIGQTWAFPGSDRNLRLWYLVPSDLDVITTPTDTYLAFTAGSASRVVLDGSTTVIPAGARGVKISNVEGGTVHYSNDKPLGTDAASFLEGLATHFYLGADLGPVAETRLAGGQALTADLNSIRTDGGGHIDKGDDMFDLSAPSRLIVADGPDGAIVLVQIWAATKEDLAEWLPQAQRLVSEFRFVDAPAEPTPTPLRTPASTPPPEATTFRSVGRDALLKVVTGPEAYLGRGYRVWACITQFDALTGAAQFRGGVWFERAKLWAADGEDAFFQGTAEQFATSHEGDVVLLEVAPIGSGVNHSPSGMASVSVPVFKVYSLERRGSCLDELPIGQDELHPPSALP